MIGINFKRTLSFIFILAFLCPLTSCFDIIDEITLNADGSGEITLTANLSKSKTKLASIMLLDTVNGYKVPAREDINHALNKAVTFLQNTEGISNVSKKVDFDNYIFSLSCHFRSVNNIDDILQEVTKNLKVKPLLFSYNFDATKKVFSKNYSYDTEVKTEYEKLKEDDKKVFDEASYTSIFRFEHEITASSNAKAKISKSKRAVMMRASALDVINGNINLTNKIQLK
ncbi:hypothetical protein JMN32_20150 [Fulvivirga sp. 29W222]|uniref:Uncharacterized protein n=1 Tax=Fulvivirga marina TaxID=2494733 RepID=A0A937G280_9BACT|nr:hypothetical protein [Fulvivirga marina]MBL6448635.1 hypothetical protein [Fulvivirga marina]